MIRKYYECEPEFIMQAGREIVGAAVGAKGGISTMYKGMHIVVIYVINKRWYNGLSI
jgi:hypothetical protein